MNIEINKIVSNSVQTKLNDIYSYKNFNLKEEDVFNNNKSLEYFEKYHGSQHQLLNYSTNTVFETEKFLNKLELNIKLYYGNVNLAYMNNFANIYTSLSEITFYTNTNLIVKISGIIPSSQNSITTIVLTSKTNNFSFTLHNVWQGGVNNNIPEQLQNCNIEKYKTLISQYLIYTIDPKIYVDYLLICDNDCINNILFDNEHTKEKLKCTFEELNKVKKENWDISEINRNLEFILEKTQDESLNYQHKLEYTLHNSEITSEELNEELNFIQEQSNKFEQELKETQQDLVITYEELNKFKNISENSEKTQQDLETTFQELDTVKYQLECNEERMDDLKNKLNLQENMINKKNILFIIMVIIVIILLFYDVIFYNK